MLRFWTLYVTPLLFLAIHSLDASLCSYTCLPDSVGSCFCVANATSSSMLWSQAKSACEADGGYLARIDNVQQEILVENLTNSYMVTGTGTYLFSTCIGKSVFIGLRRINCTGSTPMFQWNDNCLNPKLNMTQVSLPSYNMGSFTKSSNPPPFGFGTSIPGGVCSDQAHLIVTCTNWGPWEDYPINTPYLVSNFGFACRKDTNPCGSSPCVNGGICTNSLSCFTCACPCGFTGMQCEVATSCATSTTTSITTTSSSTSIALLSSSTQQLISTLSTTEPPGLTTTTSTSITTTNVPTITTTSNLPTTTTSTYSSSSTTHSPISAAAYMTTAVSPYSSVEETSEITTVLPSISNAVTKTTTAKYGTTGRTAATTQSSSLNSGNKSKWLFPVLIALVSIIVTITVVLCCVLLSRYKRSRQSKNSISSQT